MYQTLSVYEIPEGTDPDEFWKYHTEVHAVDVANAVRPLLKRYVIKRLKTVIRGKPKWFGCVEMWWDSEEDRVKAFEHADTIITASGKNIGEDFASQVTFEWYVSVEEKEIPL
ncbi:MAG: EthD family reductase [Chloroflexota bacterium]